MIRKVISGGQTGADEAGLKTAKMFGLETGGWMPSGFLTLAGPRPDFKILYGMQETKSEKYPPRTFANVRDSDGTMCFAYKWFTKGEILTKKAAEVSRKPRFEVDLRFPFEVEKAVNWVRDSGIQILNVAGNAEKHVPGTEAATVDRLTKPFQYLGLKRMEVEG